MSMGMGWGSLQGRKKEPGTLCLQTQRGEGGERGAYKLAGDSQGEPQLLAPSHSHSFHKASQVSEPAARKRGPPLSCSLGEVSSGLSLLLRKGVTWGVAYLWGSKNENTGL